MNKKILAVAVSSALAAPMAAQAVNYKLSGQVNRAMVYHNDGENSDIQFVDNTASGTRWRLTGSEAIGGGMKAGFNWEYQMPSNKGDSGGIGAAYRGTAAQDNRRAEVWFSGGWGKASLGQGPGAGDGTTEADLSDTWNVTYVIQDTFGGAIAWRTGAGSTIAGGLTHGDTYAYYDAFSRYDRIRYDSPALGPVTLAVSAGAQDKYEGAVRWSQGLGGGQISAGLFYGSFAGGGLDSRYGGSVAYLFSFGLNLAFSYSENEPSAAGSTKGKAIYGKVGYKWGNNGVSIGYGESEDAPGAVGFTDSGFNIGFNHNIPKAKVDLYAGAQWAELDVAPGTTDVDDIYTIQIGTKLKFD